jgi:phage terminase small subunit
MTSPARGYSRPPFTEGNQAARKHGVWAADAAEQAERVMNDLLPPGDIERYPFVALLFAETWVRYRRAVTAINQDGEMTGEETDRKLHPLVPIESRLRRDLLDMADRFGLDPKAEAGLARDRADATRQAVDLDAVLARGRQAWADRDGSATPHSALPAATEDGGQ